MKKEEIESIILNLGKKRITLDSVLKSQKTIWGGVGDRDVEEETVLTCDGIVVEEKITEYGQFQHSRGGDITRKELKKYTVEESIDILLNNQDYLKIVKDNVPNG